MLVNRSALTGLSNFLCKPWTVSQKPLRELAQTDILTVNTHRSWALAHICLNLIRLRAYGGGNCVVQLKSTFCVFLVKRTKTSKKCNIVK